MRILIISTFFPPLNSIASLRPYSWAKRWVEQGHQVTVLTMDSQQDPGVALQLPLEGFEIISIAAPSWVQKLKGGYRREEKAETTSSSTRSITSLIKKNILHLFQTLRHTKGVFNACRMPDFTDLWISPALRAVKEKGEWDLVVSTAGPYAVHLVAHQLKKRGQAKRWIADYRDTWSDNYIYPGIFPFNYIERKLEPYLMRRADLITTVSVPFAESLASRYGVRKVEPVENGFDTDDLAVLPLETYFPDDRKVRIVHTGSIYLGKRDPTPLFQAIAELARDPKNVPLLERLEVLFVGLHHANLEKLIAEHCVEKWVKIVGFVSREDALRMQRDADLLLFLPWNDKSVDGVLSGKIFEYLFSGTPIIAVGGGGIEASQQLILDASAGFVLNSVKEIKALVVKALNEEVPSCIANRAFINRYDRKVLADHLLNVAKEITCT